MCGILKVIKRLYIIFYNQSSFFEKNIIFLFFNVKNCIKIQIKQPVDTENIIDKPEGKDLSVILYRKKAVIKAERAYINEGESFFISPLSGGITEKTDAAVGMKSKMLEIIYDAIQPVTPRKGIKITVKRS